jgi:hypothetical protein
MAVTKYRIVSGDESDIHDEPHIEGNRVTVRQIHAAVEEGVCGRKQSRTVTTSTSAKCTRRSPTTIATPRRCDRSRSATNAPQRRLRSALR